MHLDIGQPLVVVLDGRLGAHLGGNRIRPRQRPRELLKIADGEVRALDRVEELLPARDHAELGHHENVGRQLDDLFLDVRVQPRDHRGHRHDGRDADDDAEKRQEAPELVRPDRLERRAEKLA